MSKIISTIAVLFIVVAGVAGAFYFYPAPVGIPAPFVPVEPVACTLEAKLCSDGSSVGRTGPKCEFADCPVLQVQEGTIAVLSQKILNNGVFITPLEVVSDSRCPVDVTCIWAGEVTLKVLLEKGTISKEVSLKSNTPLVFENKNITLTDVTPENNSKKSFNKGDYRFTFLVTQLVTAQTGTISGIITTSPTCPVLHIPPDPQCSPKPYATSIKIRVEGKQAVVKTIQSDNGGAYSIDLLAGSYELHAITASGSLFPRCPKVIVLVKADKTSVADISCDTGIR
jgi:hypothetical protein